MIRLYQTVFLNIVIYLNINIVTQTYKFNDSMGLIS